MDPFIGQIQAFGFRFAPQGWAQCDGQLLSVAQYSPLFSLLGTMYGGDGVQTFGLPDLRGRTPIHYGHGAGLSNYSLGEVGGTEQVTLTTSEMPNHSHPAQMKISENPATTSNGANSYLAGAAIYDGSDVESRLNAGAIAVNPAGANMPHNNMPPFTTVNYCIALYGIYPPRN